jgi:hypothetical protein
MRKADHGAFPAHAGASGFLPGVLPIQENSGLGLIRAFYSLRDERGGRVGYHKVCPDSL